MATSNLEQATIQKSITVNVTSEQNHLHCKLNAEISKKIDALEKEILHEERFQVDRVKLENMMMTCVEGKTKADLYFEQIMKSTQTQIEWLHLLKNDINNYKKHPTIRVSGRQMEDVTWAKGLILASLEVSNSVLRLKMVISNVDHYFIMGRNNNNINRIMDETQTHIQFPDPNLVKKGNQVTVHGGLDDLENTRGLLRLSCPILISFELPTNQPLPSSEKIGNYFKVQIMFSSSSKPNTLLVLIRGSTRRVDKLKKATQSLLSYALGKMANFTIVSVQLEVPPQHHESVKGENSENIISIMEHTNTKIFFPDLSIRGSRRSQVTITGSINEVLTARAELVGYFPIELTFDISAENESATEIMELGRRVGVCITISHKERDSGMSVTIKGSERLIDRIYEVHRSIREMNSMFPYDKNMANSLYLFDAAYQRDVDFLMENYVENCEDCEQYPEHTTQGEIQENSWTIYQPTYNKRPLVPQSFESTDRYARYYPPSQTYHNSYSFIQPEPDVQETLSSNERWIPSSTAAIFNAYSEKYTANLMSYHQEVQPQIIYSSETNNEQPTDWNTDCDLQETEEIPDVRVEQSSVEDVQNQLLNLELNNSELDFGVEPQSPTSVISSPLIIGSEESVAGRLICTGWGHLF